jgi:Holliday junction resolvase RusA-like endonuclease
VSVSPPAKYRFTVPGPPIPKGRPIVVQRRAVTPERTRRYERLVRMCALTAGVKPIAGPVLLSVWFYLPDARKRDGDNLQKVIWDALNGIGYRDDHQITEWHGRSQIDRANPRAVVAIEALNPGASEHVSSLYENER